MSDNGTAILGMMVAESVRKNRKITNTTSTTVSISSNCTSLTLARMVLVRSVSTVTFTEAGRLDFNCFNRRLMLSTTLIMFAPGCLWILRMTAGVVLLHAA